jgi:hypothetical protein
MDVKGHGENLLKTSSQGNIYTFPLKLLTGKVSHREKLIETSSQGNNYAFPLKKSQGS